MKELEISLEPADLGQMSLKLRLAGGKLSVTIGVANPQTLAAIQDDSALITARLASSNPSLEELVIQQQNFVSSTSETGSSNGFANDSAAEGSSGQKTAAQSRRSGASPPRSRSGGASGDLVV